MAFSHREGESPEITTPAEPRHIPGDPKISDSLFSRTRPNESLRKSDRRFRSNSSEIVFSAKAAARCNSDARWRAARQGRSVAATITVEFLGGTIALESS